MNICLIGTDIGPSVNGVFVRGHVNNIVRLSKELTRLGNNIEIITNLPEFSNASLYEKWVDFANIHYFSTTFPSLKENGPEFLIKALFRTISTNSKKKFDIINVHSGYPALAILTASIKKLTPIKTVHTLYSPFDYAITNSSFDRYFFSRFSEVSLSSLDKIIAVTENVKRSLIARNISIKKIAMIPPIVDEDFLNTHAGSKIRLDLGIADSVPVVTYVGGFEQSKGLKILIKIIQSVIKCVPETVFVIALNRPSSDSRFNLLKEEASLLGISKNIRLIGIVDNLSKILSIGDFFVAPYTNTMGVADYPLAIFEAMALKKVVIAFDVGGISEMLKEGRGIVIRSGDVASFTYCVINMIKNNVDVNNMGELASEFVAANFSPKNVAMKTLELFSSLIED